SLHLPFFLSFTVHTVPSLETDGIPSARSGTTFRFLSATYMFGYMKERARKSGTVDMTNGFKLSASESSAQISVPPFFTALVVGAEVPHADTSIAIVAASVETRNHFDLPTATSIYVNSSLPGRVRSWSIEAVPPNRRNHASSGVKTSRNRAKY